MMTAAVSRIQVRLYTKADMRLVSMRVFGEVRDFKAPMWDQSQQQSES